MLPQRTKHLDTALLDNKSRHMLTTTAKANQPFKGILLKTNGVIRLAKWAKVVTLTLTVLRTLPNPNPDILLLSCRSCTMNKAVDYRTPNLPYSTFLGVQGCNLFMLSQRDDGFAFVCYR